MVYVAKRLMQVGVDGFLELSFLRKMSVTYIVLSTHVPKLNQTIVFFCFITAFDLPRKSLASQATPGIFRASSEAHFNIARVGSGLGNLRSKLLPQYLMGLYLIFGVP